jgi:hypothetical protein
MDDAYLGGERAGGKRERKSGKNPDQRGDRNHVTRSTGAAQNTDQEIETQADQDAGEP